MDQDLLVTGSSDNIFEQITQAEYGSHYLLIHPERGIRRDIYSRYVKKQLESNNEIVLMLTHYETADKVRRVLSEGYDKENDGNGIDVTKYETEGSLVIIDSIEGHFGSDDLMISVKQLVKKSQSSGKNGVSMISDGGSYFHLHKPQKLMKHEMSMPSKFDINLKRICVFHRKDFDILSEEQKQKLVKHHGRGLVVN